VVPECVCASATNLKVERRRLNCHPPPAEAAARAPRTRPAQAREAVVGGTRAVADAWSQRWRRTKGPAALPL